MPNHVKNVLKFKNLKKGQIDILINNLTTIEDGQRCFDFNKIIEMPDSLMLVSGTLENFAIEYVEMQDNELHLDKKEKLEKRNEDFIKDIKENKYINEYSKTYQKYNINNLYDLGKLYLNNKKEYGVTSWYDWCIENWGTKWNAYDQSTEEGKTFVKFIFSTAWSMPKPIYDKLRELNLNFEVKYADEDIGYNCGIYSYIDGKTNYVNKEGCNNWCRNLWKNN